MNLKDSPNIDYNELIVRFLSGNVSDKEIELLHTWINQSDKNKEEFNQMKISWMASAQLNKKKPGDIQKALNQLNRKINQKKEIASELFLNRIRYIIKIAAAIILFISTGAIGTYFILKNGVSEQNLVSNTLVSVYAPKGSKAVTILPDGTKVWLNAGSDITYNPASYGKNDRQITLIGEGFFDVVTNPEKPFIVNAKDLKIMALGTEFNVKAYPEEDNVETTLVEGIVKVNGKNTNKQSFSVMLKPNQQVTFHSGKSIIDSVVLTDPVNVDAQKRNEIKLKNSFNNLSAKPTITNIDRTDIYTSWKDERWVFKGEEIAKLAVLLERRFNVQIIFNSEELKRYKFTGTFQNETLEQVLQVLKLTTPLQYKIGKGIVTLNLDSGLKMKYNKYLNN